MKRAVASDIWPAVLFLLPNFIGFVLFTAGPVLFSLGASFTSWDLQRSVPFAFTGFDNLIALLHDDKFWLYFINTIYLMIGLPFSIAGALILALLLSRKMRGMPIYRTLFYLPSFTSGVALIILWKALFNADFGPINYVIAHCGITPPNWLWSTHNLLGVEVDRVRFGLAQWGLGAKDALVIMGIWTAVGGNNLLLYLAALTNVPQDLYEAAGLDGANKWQTFWNVTWPQIMPTTFFILVMSTIGGLQGGFEQAKVMTQGKPANTTVSLTFYIYLKAFEEYQMGYASAIAWVLFSMIFVMTLINWRFGRESFGD